MFKLTFFRANMRQLIKAYSVDKTDLTIKDIPRSKSGSLFGISLDLILSGGGTKLHEYIDKRHKTYGDTFVERMGKADIIFTSDPRLMKALFINLEGKYPQHILPDPWVLYEKIHGSQRGLFFMNGSEWLAHRRIMNKHLLQNNPETWLYSPVRGTVSNFMTILKTATENSQTVDLESNLYNLSIQVIINILLGPNSTILRSNFYDELIISFADSVKRVFTTTTKLQALPLQISYRFNLKLWRDFEDSVITSLKLAQKIVAEILRNKDNLGDGLMKKLCSDNMNEESLTKVIADFIIAAGDTTSYSTLWTLFLLAKNQNYLEEVRNNNIKFIKYILRESMRLYPVAPFLTRILNDDCNFGGFQLCRGTPIVASIYTSGRDERYFSKANEFLPFRWDRKDPRSFEVENHEPSASLPFAMGSRSCIGKRIALLQLTEVIQQMVANFNFECEGDTAEMKANTSQVLVPDRPLKLRFTPIR